MNYRTLSAVICGMALASFALTASAQDAPKSESFFSFNSISAGDNFAITLKKAASVKAEWNVDKEVEQFVSVHSNGKTLSLEFDRKSLPKELKAKYKGNEEPMFQVTIYAPEIKGITLAGHASLDAAGQEFTTDDFTLSMTENSTLCNLKVSATNATVDLAKNAKASLELSGETAKVTATNASVLNLTQKVANLNLTSNYSSKITADGESSLIVTNSNNSSLLTLSGKTENLNVNGQGSSRQECLELAARLGETHISGSCNVRLNVEAILKIEMKNARLYFTGEPSIEIVKVESGTIMPVVE